MDLDCPPPPFILPRRPHLRVLGPSPLLLLLSSLSASLEFFASFVPWLIVFLDSFLSLPISRIPSFGYTLLLHNGSGVILFVATLFFQPTHWCPLHCAQKFTSSVFPPYSTLNKSKINHSRRQSNRRRLSFKSSALSCHLNRASRPATQHTPWP